MDPAYDEDPDLYFADSSTHGESLASAFLASSATGEIDSFYENGVPQDGGFSLAQELAGALLAEPSSDTKALADELGFEFDAGAEEAEDGGRNDLEHGRYDASPTRADDTAQSHPNNITRNNIPPSTPRVSTARSRSALQYSPLVTDISQDYLDTLAKNVQSVDAFLSRLESIDSEPTSKGLPRNPTLEDSLTHLLKKLRDTASEREFQVKGMEQIGRDLRQRTDIQLHMPEIEVVEGWMEGSGVYPTTPKRTADLDTWRPRSNLSQIMESPDEASPIDEEEDVFSADGPKTPTASSAQSKGPVARIIASLVEFRSTNDSLIRSLTSISEQAQVNAAANADAGRKLRALRNRVGEWRDEWESAERSRLWIEHWERGEWPDDFDNVPPLSTASSSAGDSPSRSPGTPSRSIRAKDIVDAQLKAFTLSARGATDAANVLRSVCGLNPELPS